MGMHACIHTTLDVACYIQGCMDVKNNRRSIIDLGLCSTSLLEGKHQLSIPGPIIVTLIYCHEHKK